MLLPVARQRSRWRLTEGLLRLPSGRAGCAGSVGAEGQQLDDISIDTRRAERALDGNPVMSVDDEMASVEPVHGNRRQRFSTVTCHPHQPPPTARPTRWPKRVIELKSLLRLDGSDDRVHRDGLYTQMTATCLLTQGSWKELQATRPPPAEALSPPLPDQALECMLGVDPRKPGDRKDAVDHQRNRGEPGDDRE